MDPFPAAVEPPPLDSGNSKAGQHAQLIAVAVVLLITLGLLVYSQTMGFVWDEGFHLLAAQLILRGEKPYLDFCFPQTPLNAYWNAAWMALFGESWRATHVAAALVTAAAVFLITDFVFRRLTIARWRLPAALTAAFFVGLNTTVVQFATVAQAYGMGMFLSVAAFRISLGAVQKSGWSIAFAAGLLAGAAAGSTLLTAPVAPVLLIWMLIYNRGGSRWAKMTAFLAGCLIPFAPVFWLFVQSPRQVFFNVVQYQALFRRVNWTGATPHDVDVLSAWLNDSQALLLGFLALAGIWFLRKRSSWDTSRRSEFYLCAWLSAALVLYIGTAHPTFTRYFIFATPFATVLAVIGLYAVGSRLVSPERPLVPAAVVMLLLALSLARALFDDRDAVTWHDYSDIARKVDQVTPAHGRLYADELVYFLTRRPPPSGMEFSYSHKLELPPAQEALYHIVSERELNEQVKAGKFATVQSCNDDRIEDMHLEKLFPNKADIVDCSVFWGKVKSSGAAPKAQTR
ncbi:MAG: hypothetical protein JO091_01105 [Acidobacteriaceae bacterium]|nr:hypothetical protein [Acidobacteriaceae bacterium]